MGPSAGTVRMSDVSLRSSVSSTLLCASMVSKQVEKHQTTLCFFCSQPMAERPLSGEAGCRRTLARLRDAADDPDEVTRTLRTLRAACRRVVNHDGYGDSGLETNVVGWMLDAGVPGAVADAMRANAGDEDVQVEASKLVSDLARAMAEHAGGRIDRDTRDDDAESSHLDPDEDPPLVSPDATDDDEDPIGDAYFDVGYATRVAECARILSQTSPVHPRTTRVKGKGRGEEEDDGSIEEESTAVIESDSTSTPTRTESDVDALVASLGTLKFFRDVGSDHAVRVMLRAATVEEFRGAPGVSIVKEGDVNDAVRIVLGGEVGCHVRLRPGECENGGDVRDDEGPSSSDRPLVSIDGIDDDVEARKVSEYPIVNSEVGVTIDDTVERLFGPRRELDFNGGGGGGPGGILRTGRWFGTRDPVVVTDGVGACTSMATYVTRTDDVILLAISSELCRECLVESAVAGSLTGFFGDAGGDDDEVNAGTSSMAPRAGWEYGESVWDAAERSRRLEKSCPMRVYFVDSGLTDALLHRSMGSHPLSPRVQIAALRAIRTVALEPCGEATRRLLGAAGALDRVAAAATAAEFYGGEDGGAGVKEEAKLCLQALTMGCEQNMRAALALGCERMVW